MSWKHEVSAGPLINILQESQLQRGLCIFIAETDLRWYPEHNKWEGCDEILGLKTDIKTTVP